MILIVSQYKAIMPTVEIICKANAQTKVTELCSNIAAVTQAPLLAVCYFVEKVRGSSQELEDLKDRLKHFYGYEQVIYE